VAVFATCPLSVGCIAPDAPDASGFTCHESVILALLGSAIYREDQQQLDRTSVIAASAVAGLAALPWPVAALAGAAVFLLNQAATRDEFSARLPH
jgi:hypothetical protein